ncbi:dienelactone hydrolase family protein [Dactylosporangium sucinum]|uniref:Carboxymethylenebutenolidase n=1 Tax=Dactylosporangium sucinum TaxID=1424081 RepID=A0A917X529_9ACTN|nr:dienelactone hydrolase family protein [Dactylosporangium sucinum]GGM67375.1 carboxymethylenebutenolidase [Dactylosporangium sucinum]
MRITLPSGTPAILARPRPEPPAGFEHGLVLLPDVFGLRPLYDDLCGQLSQRWGTVVCAPEPFPGRDLPPDVPARLAASREIPDADRLRDIAEAADATGCTRLSLIGFCQGGTYAYHASQLDRFARLVAFYGPVRPPEAGLGPGQARVLDTLAEGRPGRVLALLGGRDPLVPEDDAAALEHAGVTVVRYPQAGHGFAHDPDRPTHRAADAADAWHRCGDWLRL